MLLTHALTRVIWFAVWVCLTEHAIFWLTEQAGFRVPFTCMILGWFEAKKRTTSVPFVFKPSSKVACSPRLSLKRKVVYTWSLEVKISLGLMWLLYASDYKATNDSVSTSLESLPFFASNNIGILTLGCSGFSSNLPSLWKVNQSPSLMFNVAHLNKT